MADRELRAELTQLSQTLASIETVLNVEALAVKVALNGTLTRGYRLEMAPVGSDYPTIPIAPLIPSLDLGLESLLGNTKRVIY